MKKSKAIVVGGPIAVGKSTLVGALPFVPIQELDPNDELQKLLLQKMYEGDKIAPQVFQLDMLLTRHDKYVKLANHKDRHVFDRSILEDVYFAERLLQGYENIWNYYHSIWLDKVEEMKNEVGFPELYILLTCDWQEFEKRVFDRNRKAETDNFEKNKAYFKEMIEGYESYMVNIFKKYAIDHIIINTNEMSKTDVIDFVKNELKSRGIK